MSETRRIAILYAPEGKEYGETAEILGKACEKLKLEATVKAAKSAEIPDILAANIVVFGSAHNKSDSLHSHFSEMVRAFEGINLAGRLAGFISYDGNNSPELFRKVLKDTDITPFADDLVIRTGSTRPDEIRAWAERLCGSYKGDVDE